MNTFTSKVFSRSRQLTIALFTLVLCCACTSPYIAQSPPLCDFGGLRFNSDYAGGRVDGCAQTGPDSYALTMSPENSPINHSPWYSFRVDSDEARSISVSLEYTEHEHRYVPKLSADGESWTAMQAQDVEILADGEKALLTLKVGPAPLWVSAQEIYDNDDYLFWTEQLEQKPFIQRTLLGKSTEGRDIFKLESAPTTPGKYVIFVGRQHPPEVTGALAMVAFIERVLADDELATEFRRQFGILIVPNLNPDGVFHGNWRHNVNGVDLNRDWGPFTQPETQLMRDELARFLDPNAPKPYLFLDFHSTAHDVFYTQLPEMGTIPENFTDEWMSAIELRAETDFPGYTVTWTPGHNAEQPTSKNYIYNTFGIPAITFELGDETDREFINAYAATAAEEMMKNLLDNSGS